LEQEIIYRKELETLKGAFKMITTVTAGEFPAWDGETGRIQTFLEKYFKPGYEVFICGPAGMVEASEQKLVDLGQPKEQIFVDKWE